VERDKENRFAYNNEKYVFVCGASVKRSFVRIPTWIYASHQSLFDSYLDALLYSLFVLYGCETWSLTPKEEHSSEQGAEENIWS
jgi:hypothetical protein